MDIRALKAKRAKLLAEAKTIQGKAQDEKRDLTDDEFADIKAKMDEASKLAETISAAEARAKTLADLKVQVEQVEAAPARQTAPDDAATETVNTAAHSVISSHDNVLDDPKRGFKHMGEFGLAVYRAGQGQADERLRIGAAAGSGMEQGVKASGGYLVPPSFSSTIWEGVNDQPENLLALTDQYTLPAGSDSITFPADAETSRADGSRAGGIQGYWKSELTQMTASNPTLREVKLEPQELYVFVYASDKLLRNSTVLESYISRKASEELNFKIGDAIINGTGSGMPKGIMPSACTVDVAKETGQAADTIVVKNIDKMWARIFPRSQARGIWLYDQSCFAQLQSLNRSVGSGGLPVYSPPTGVAGAPFGTIFGRPARPCEFCGAVGDNGDIIFADLGGYVTVVQGGVQSAVSIHLKFDYNQTAFRFIMAIDGQPWLASAVTPFTPSGGTTKTATLSTFAAIAARA